MKISKKELKELYEKEKLSTYAIADIYGCCQGTVWKRLHDFGIHPRRPWNAVDLPKEKLEKLYTTERLSTWQIEKQYGHPRGTVHRKLCEYNIKRRTSAEAHRIYPRKDFDGSGRDKAYLIGFAMGDLRVRKVYPNSETIHVDCGSNKIEQIKLISDLFKGYGRVWIKPNPARENYLQIECSVNMSFSFLLKKRILMDEWIRRNQEYFYSFFAGFTDAEGCIAISKLGQAFYGLGNYNHRLLKQIRDKLTEIGICCGKLIEGKTKGRKFGSGAVHNQNYWQLRILRKVSLLKLFDLMGPHLRHEKRIKDMARARENIALRNLKYGNINM